MTAGRARSAGVTLLARPGCDSSRRPAYVIQHDIRAPQVVDLWRLQFIPPGVVGDTRKVARLDVDRFDAIVVAGGRGTMFTFDAASDLHWAVRSTFWLDRKDE